MNVVYEADEAVPTDTTVIKTNSDFENLNKFLDYVKSYDNRLRVKSGDIAYMIDIGKFIRFYSAAKYVYAGTMEKEYHILKRLYELENILPVQFVRVSNSEIINLNYVSHFSLSAGGIINIVFKNGIKTSSSRRYLKRIKEVLYHEK